MSRQVDHIQTLILELDKLQREFDLIETNYKDIQDACLVVASDFKKFKKQQKKLNRSFEKHKNELWASTVHGNTTMAARAEVKLNKVIEEQIHFQRKVPDKYKTWALMAKNQIASFDKRAEWKMKIILKEEEIHRFKPCDRLACRHCKRLDVAALKRAKVGFKDGVVRILNIKLK